MRKNAACLLLCTITLALFLGGCGLKGDLYLPDDPPPETADESDGNSSDDD